MNLKFTSANSKRIYSHLKLVGINSDIRKGILAELHKWTENNGEEWTVSRLKDLKTWFIQHHAGNVSYRPAWFRSTQGNIPKGVFGHLFKDGLNPRKVIKTLSAFMVYTAYRSPSVTEKQVRKTIGSIISSDVLSDELTLEARKFGASISKDIKTQPIIRKFHPAGLNTGKPGEWSDEKYISSYISGLSVPLVSRYLERHLDAPSALGLPVWDSDERMLSPGDISVIQERGYKARVIAVPKASVQVALYPLHQHLNRILKQLPTDCTHSQEDGALFAQQALLDGKTVYSVDLSGATDNFPRSFQIGILEGLNLREEAELLESLSKANWRLSPDLQNATGLEYVSYSKGQPQGLYGSFALFALSHNLLLSGFCDSLGLDPVENFRILGDDIVITNGDLYNKYIFWLETFKVPISWDKTVTSDLLAEFAGFVIEPHHIWKPAKVPNDRIDSNFMSYLKVVGIKGIYQLPSRLRKVARKVAELPTMFGGLGLNPNGTPAWIRALDLIKTESDVKIPKYLSMQPRLTAALYRAEFSDVRVYVEWLNDQFSTFESEVGEVITQLSDYSASTQKNEFLYQLSILNGMEDSGCGLAMSANISDMAPATHSFISEFSAWQHRFHEESQVRRKSKIPVIKPSQSGPKL